MLAPAPLDEPSDFSLILGGPLYQMFRRAHLTGPALELFLRRQVVFFILLCWVPLAVLSWFEAHFLGGTKLSFARDVLTQVRLLVALPVMILGEAVVHRRIGPAVKRFIEGQVVTSADLPKFCAAIDSVMRLRNSVIAEIALLAFVFTGGIWIWRHRIAIEVTSWYASSEGGRMHFTLAGYWFAFVCLPIFQFIWLRWYLRLFIWFWFLFRVSRLKLHLLAAHPDRAGGLGFLGKSTYAFMPLLFAQGALASGQIAERIFFEGRSLLSFKLPILGVVSFLVVAILAPLFVFAPLLARAKREGLKEYGALASSYVTKFNQKWLQTKFSGEELLGTSDLQSLADLDSSFTIIREMGTLPFARDDVARLLVVTVAPFVPLLLTIMPLDELLTEAVKMML
jgi:hypothetical protein